MSSFSYYSSVFLSLLLFYFIFIFWLLFRSFFIAVSRDLYFLVLVHALIHAIVWAQPNTNFFWRCAHSRKAPCLYQIHLVLLAKALRTHSCTDKRLQYQYYFRAKSSTKVETTVAECSLTSCVWARCCDRFLHMLVQYSQSTPTSLGQECMLVWV